ncbi:MAG: hypothetical protein OXE94_07350 [Aestuariivita sp.]|nr:hypothetical protein [Aestuariivita sp.]MCY4202052.1 hypothetical protein [Aestuariivita sp.]
MLAKVMVSRTDRTPERLREQDGGRSWTGTDGGGLVLAEGGARGRVPKGQGHLGKLSTIF